MEVAIQDDPEAALRDPRLCELRAAVASGRYDLLSLDVFDTLVWRMVPLPQDVHFVVGHRLADRGAVYPSSSPESFARERIQAEERARRRRPSGEATLDEIYAEFPAGYLRGLSPAQLPAIEYEVERELVRPNEEMVDLIRHAREHGLRIALVSDTYFRAEQVAALARVDADFVLVSCEHNASKFQGLHRVLLGESGVPASRILHVGDDHRADVEGPSVFGIDRYRYEKAPSPMEEILAAELPAAFSQRSPYVAGPDGGLDFVRRRAAASGSDPYERWGAGVLGPVVAGFADWVAERCAAEGIELALCLMREGRILKALIDATAGPLRTSEFFASRFVARKAAILEGTEAELQSFVRRPSPRRRGRILQQLGLGVDHPWAGRENELLAPEEALVLAGRIARDAGLRRRVLRSSAEMRARLLAHLRRCAGSLEGRRLAIVDLGYQATSQGCLERILDREGIGARTHGLYLVTGAEAWRAQATGAVVEGWLAENGQPIAMAQTFVRSPELFEQSLMADCGTTVGYQEDGSPILDSVHVPAPQTEQIAAVQRGALRYASLWNEHRRRHASAPAARLLRFYRAICVRAAARPVPEELALFGEWVHDENFGSGRARGLLEVEGLDPWEESHASAHQVASLPPSRIYWPCGFARRIGPNMGSAVASIFLRAVEPEAFNSSLPAGCLIAYWDTGRGFHAEQSRVVSYAQNDRGNVWLRLSLEHEGAMPAAFGFTIGLPGEVLRLTGIRLVQTGARGTTRSLRFPHEEIEKHGYHRLHGNLYRVHEDPALLVIRPDRGDTEARTDIDLFFGIIAGG